MAAYYVSAQRGNDENNGTSSATPWLTITKAIGVVAAGDTVYIGAGTYREKPSLATAGSDGNPITWIPDPSAKYVTGDNPGRVRITGCDADEYPTSGVVWDFNAKTYNTLGSLDGRCYIDGSSNNYSVSPGNITAAICINVVSHGNYGFSRGTNTNCIAVGGDRGFHQGTNTNCIAIGGYYGFNQATNTNCIVIGGYYGFNQGTNTNCIAIGGNYGFYQATNTNCIAIGGYYGFRQGTNTNCIAVGGNFGFNGSSAHTFSYCRAVACYYGFYGDSTANKMNIATCSWVWCSINFCAGGYTTEDGSAAKAIIYDLAKLAEALKPVYQFNLDDGDDGASAGDFDILGHVRRLGDGSIDIGAIEHSLIDTDFTTYKTQSPAVKISRKGMEKFTFWAESGKEFTKSVWVKWSNYAGADKPQLIAKGKHIADQTDTATGDGSDWEELTVSATPSADGEIELFIYARDVDASAITYFSDLE